MVLGKCISFFSYCLYKCDGCVFYVAGRGRRGWELLWRRRCTDEYWNGGEDASIYWLLGGALQATVRAFNVLCQ
jgi:hypothetical protein